MPQFNERQIQQTVNEYTGIGLNTVYDQAVAIMGECEQCDRRVLYTNPQNSCHYLQQSSFVLPIYS